MIKIDKTDNRGILLLIKLAANLRLSSSAVGTDFITAEVLVMSMTN